MSIDNVTTIDAALVLDGLSQVFSLMPPLDEIEQQERLDVARACREAAQAVSLRCASEQDFRSAQLMVGDEWRNALLRSLLGLDGAEQALLSR